MCVNFHISMIWWLWLHFTASRSNYMSISEYIQCPYILDRPLFLSAMSWLRSLGSICMSWLVVSAGGRAAAAAATVSLRGVVPSLASYGRTESRNSSTSWIPGLLALPAAGWHRSIYLWFTTESWTSSLILFVSPSLLCSLHAPGTRSTCRWGTYLVLALPCLTVKPLYNNVVCLDVC